MTDTDDKQAKTSKGGGDFKGPQLPKGLTELEQYQVEHGQAPIAPGPEEPVDEEVAQAAKEHRGRGLGG